MSHNHSHKGNAITTVPFAVAPSVHAALAASRILSRYWWAAAIPVATLLILGLSDWRYAVTALALIFVVLPAVAMFGWLAATSDADAVADMTEHSLRLNPDNTISTIRPENIHTSPADAHISVSLFRKNIVVTISHNGKTQRIIAPVSAFATQADAAEFYHRLDVSE